MNAKHNPSSKNSFNTQSSFKLNQKTYTFFDLKKLQNPEYSHNKQTTKQNTNNDRLSTDNAIQHLPYSLKILLENLLRHEDGVSVRKEDIEALMQWSPNTPATQEIAFTPARVILQDFTGVPAIVDLAAMRDAMKKLKGDPAKINPLTPVELVIDHSVMVDYSGSPQSFQKNVEKEFARNEERYAFLRWGQKAFENFKVVPPGTGIVHQVNLEYLARVVFEQTLSSDDTLLCYPDTLVGTDSHTTMINGLGVLGWGVGGIEAEAAMLGQPITMLIPEVVGFKLSGKLKEGSTATDLVLTIVEMLRRKNVVGKFVEFYGEGLNHLPLADRATIANMAPEYGATCGIFPIDDETLNYLKLSGRSDEKIKLVEYYAKTQGLFREKDPHSDSNTTRYSDYLELDLNQVEACIAGPKRPQDRILLKAARENFRKQFPIKNEAPLQLENKAFMLHDGAVVIAAITSCTNTSNPAVMIAAGLTAKKAVALGLKTQPWVKTSLAPGSQVVMDYFEKAGLIEPLSALGFELVGYGCTTCIGNSGPLLPEVSRAIQDGKLSVAAALSGNRNFEGRIHPDVKLSYLASPPLVIAYALAGRADIDFYEEPIAVNANGQSIYLKDIWPSQTEIAEVLSQSLQGDMFRKRYQSVYAGSAEWQQLKISEGELFDWQTESTYIKNPPYFKNLNDKAENLKEIQQARVLAIFGDSITTDHISPAGDISPKSPAGIYLQSLNVEPQDFNSYGARRGNHEVMMRGTFANSRIKNLMMDKEGSYAIHLPTQETLSMYDAALRYQQEQTPLIILAGKEYGSGSSRDWAAKGTKLLGIVAVIAESFERIHRSNLIGMAVLPLEFLNNENAQTLNLSGHEQFSISIEHLKPKQILTVTAQTETGDIRHFQVQLRIDTPKELEYYQQGGILQYVLRQALA